MAMALLEYLTRWLSPGMACFLLLNVLVAAIAVTSRSRSRAQAQQGGRAASTRRRLCRSASSMVLDRLRSFSATFSTHTSVELSYYYNVSPQAQDLKQVSGAAPDRRMAVPEPAAMAAMSMMLMSENAEYGTAAGAVKSMSSDGNGACELGVQEGRHHAQEAVPSPPPAAAPAVAVVTAAETASVAALVRGPPKEDPPAAAAEFVKRKHHRARVYAVEGKAELNARAEHFILKFRQELKLQRLDSMLGRHTHTLSTGSGAPKSR